MSWGKPEVKEVKCSEVKSPDIFIEIVARQKISCLMEEYEWQEWLAYLVGRKSDMDNFFVEDIIVPPHANVSGASAEAEPHHVPKNCIGVIHSHHRMGAFHSAIDSAHVDKNYPISITVAHNSGNISYDAISYQKAPCGKKVTIPCTVKYVAPPLMFDKDEWLKHAKENIDKGRKVYVFNNKKTMSVIPMRKQVNLEDTQNMREYMTNLYGTVLTRAEIEDLLQKGEYPYGEYD